MSRDEAMRRLAAANPVPAGTVSSVIRAEERARVLDRIVRLSPRERRANGPHVPAGSVDVERGAREYAGAALAAAVIRAQRARRRTVVLFAVLIAAVIAGAAYAVVHQLIVGSPAPPEVREQPARFGHPELIPVPHPDDPRLDKARVAAVLDSSAGTVYLFASPNARGFCASTWVEGDRGYEGRLNISSACGPGDQSFYSFANHDAGVSAGHDYRKHPLRLFSGRAGNGVTRIALRFGRRIVDVPMTGRWFLAEFEHQPDEFLSYDASGRVLERHAFNWHLPRLPTAAIPHQVTHAHEVAHVDTRGGERISLFVAQASDGGYCQIVRSDRRPSNRTCSVAVPTPRQIGVSGMNFGGAPGGVLLLVGPVGSRITTLELRYQDNRVDQLPLHDRWALYEVLPNNYARGRRPETLVARDASGHTVGTRGFPWR